MSPSKTPLVSIIILNWNGGLYVQRCLDHVLKQSYKPIELIIVDNGSNDGSLEKLKQSHRECIYIENSDNRGFAAGMNQGISIAKGDFIVPLNQDVCLHKEFISACVGKILTDEDIGAIGGRVFAWVGDELTGDLRKGEGERTYLLKRFHVIGGVQTDGEAWVFVPTGSFPFLRKKMLDDLYLHSGYFYDEKYVTGFEDMDLFFRMHLRNWKCLFLPSASGWHVGSGSVGGKSTFFSKKTDYQIKILRNRYFTMFKNLPASIFWWLSPYLFLTEAAMLPYFLLRSPKSILAWLVAWYQFVGSLPDMVIKRQRIQKSKLVKDDYLKQFFITY